MIILTIVLLFAVALVLVVYCIGAAMAYEVVFAAIAGALLGPLL